MSVKYPEDCARIQRFLNSKGCRLTLEGCEALWQHFSENRMCATWMFVPERDEDLAKDLAPYVLAPEPRGEEAEQQSCTESDGCPTETAVLKRFWRDHQRAALIGQLEILRAKNCTDMMDRFDGGYSNAIDEVTALLRGG